MNQFIRKTWVQVIFFGIIIGGGLILADAKFNWFGGNNNTSKKFNGPVEANKDDIYFTSAAYSSFSFDFGKVKEGDTVIHAFNIKNTGKEPLYIFKVTGSCDCLAPFYSDKPVPPGQEGTIRIHFNTKGRKGQQARTVSISTNTEPSEAILTLTGIVE